MLWSIIIRSPDMVDNLDGEINGIETVLVPRLRLIKCVGMSLILTYFAGVHSNSRVKLFLNRSVLGPQLTGESSRKPMLWRESKDNTTDCCFYLINLCRKMDIKGNI